MPTAEALVGWLLEHQDAAIRGADSDSDSISDLFSDSDSINSDYSDEYGDGSVEVEVSHD